MSRIHHVTAMSGNSARDLEFHTHIIGMRFVKYGAGCLWT